MRSDISINLLFNLFYLEKVQNDRKLNLINNKPFSIRFLVSWNIKKLKVSFEPCIPDIGTKVDGMSLYLEPRNKEPERSPFTPPRKSFSKVTSGEKRFFENGHEMSHNLPINFLLRRKDIATGIFDLLNARVAKIEASFFIHGKQKQF